MSIEKKLDETSSPAMGLKDTKEVSRARRSRIPMSVPKLKLEVPPIPGYRTYWFKDEPGRIAQAMAAGYTFVDEDEVDLNITSTLAESSLGNGNTDLGSRISLVGDRSTGERLYLMKIPEEYYLQDQAALEEVNSRVDRTIKKGRVGADEDRHDDADKRYSSNEYEPLRKRRDM